ncbi:uncharacterized protein [Aegilops tauschii subsp. strangulata]|uniref:uncharacterized protein isoform X2 n=1 Tax=Aegilops tauschii subsp. strangulata TaxID=200361 RepID=UPI003CC87C7A
MSASESRKAGDWALPYKGLAATSASGTTCARAIAGRSVGCREHGGNRRRHEDGMWRMALRDGCCGTVAVVLSMDNQILRSGPCKQCTGSKPSRKMHCMIYIGEKKA